MIKGRHVAFLLFDQVQLFLRVVDEGGQGAALLRAHIAPEGLVNFQLDDPRGVLQDMGEGGVLPVDIADEMLGALGQVQDGLQVDNLGGGLLDVAVALAEQAQVFQFGLGEFHGDSFLSPCCLFLFSSFSFLLFGKIPPKQGGGMLSGQSRER